MVISAMSRLLAIVAFLCASLSARAQTCYFSAPGNLVPSRPFFGLATDPGGFLMVVENLQIPIAFLSAANSLLAKENSASAAAEADIQKLLNANKEFQGETGSLRLFLQTVLQDGSANGIYVDYAPASLAQARKYAGDLFRQNHQPAAEELIGITIGAPLALWFQEPDLFKNVEFADFNLDLANLRPTPAVPPASSAKRQAAEFRHRLMNEFSRNHRTRRKFEQFARQFDSGEFDRLTVEQTARQVLPHFWSRVRSKIREWIVLELRARHERGEPARAPASAGPLAPYLQPHRTSLALVPPLRYEWLEQALHSVCKLHR